MIVPRVHAITFAVLPPLAFVAALLPGQEEVSRDRERPEPIEETWILEIRPIADSFVLLSDVRLVLTVRNVGDEPRSVCLPFRENHAWPKWIQVFRDGVQLPSGHDPDSAVEEGLLAPGSQVSALVPIRNFLSPQEFETPGIGSYEVTWSGGTIGFASSARASFSVLGYSTEGPEPGSLESFLPQPRVGESDVARARSVWTQLVSDPSDPKWLAYLAIVPAEAVEGHAAFTVLESTKDLGIQRGIVHLLGRIGKNLAIADRLIEFLRRHPDPSLLALAGEALQQLRGS